MAKNFRSSSKLFIFEGNGALRVPAGTTSEQPTATDIMSLSTKVRIPQRGTFIDNDASVSAVGTTSAENSFIYLSGSNTLKGSYFFTDFFNPDIIVFYENTAGSAKFTYHRITGSADYQFELDYPTTTSSVFYIERANFDERSIGLLRFDTSLQTMTYWDGSNWEVFATVSAVLSAGLFVEKAGDTMTGVLELVTGSDAAPGLAFDDSSSTGVYSPSTGEIALTTTYGTVLQTDAGDLILGKPETVRIDTSGDLVAANSDVYVSAGSIFINQGAVEITGVSGQAADITIQSEYPLVRMIPSNVSGVSRMQSESFGISTLEIDPKVLDNVSDSEISLFKNTETTGLKTLRLYSVSANPSVQISTGSSVSYFRDSFVGILKDSPEYPLDVGGTGAIRIPSGTTAEQPFIAPVSASDGFGLIRFNTDFLAFEFHNGGGWQPLDFSTISNVFGTTFVTTRDNGTYSETIRFGTDGVIRGVVTSAGNFGIGTDSPNEALTIERIGSDSFVEFRNSITGSSGNLIGTRQAQGELELRTQSNNDVVFYRNNIEKIRLTASNISYNNNRLTNVADPVNPQDAATKFYVDGLATGLDWKGSVDAGTSLTSDLSGFTYNPGNEPNGQVWTGTSTPVFDGVTLTDDFRVMIKDASDQRGNGIFRYDGSAAFFRTIDADNTPNNEVSNGMAAFISQGTVNNGTSWVLTQPDGVANLGTDNLEFTQFAGTGTFTGGNGIQINGSVVSLTSSVSIFDNLSVSGQAFVGVGGILTRTNINVNPDLHMFDNGVQTTEGNVYYSIDSDNNSTTRRFVWGHDSSTASGIDSNKLMELSETGNLTITGNIIQNDVYVGPTKNIAESVSVFTSLGTLPVQLPNLPEGTIVTTINTAGLNIPVTPSTGTSIDTVSGSFIYENERCQWILAGGVWYKIGTNIAIYT